MGKKDTIKRVNQRGMQGGSGAGGGITIVRDIATDVPTLDLNANFTWGGMHWFRDTITARSIVPEAEGLYDLGAPGSAWRRLHVREIDSSLLPQGAAQIISGQLTICGSAGALPNAVGEGADAITFGQTMTPGAFVRLTTAAQTEYIQVGALLEETTYAVTRGMGSPNLALNPGFETAGGGGVDVFADWLEAVIGSGTVVRTTTAGEYYGGAAAAKLTYNAGQAEVYQLFTVSPGQSMRLSFWTRGDGANAGWYKVRDMTHSVDFVAKVSTGIAGASYAEIAVQFVVPASCTQIQLELFSPQVAGWCCFDDVSLTVAACYWPAGSVYEVLGPVGAGRIEMVASPVVAMQVVKQGATADTKTRLVRLGDLQGQWGYAAGTERYGLAVGEYAAGKANLTWDEVNGLCLRTYDMTVLQLDNAGNASIAGWLGIGAAGGIYQGSGTPAAPQVGLKIYNSGGVGLLEAWGEDAANPGTYIKQVYFNTAGELLAGGGAVKVNSLGITIDTSGGDAQYIRFYNGATYWGGFMSATNLAGHGVITLTAAPEDRPGDTMLMATDTAGAKSVEVALISVDAMMYVVPVDPLHMTMPGIATLGGVGVGFVEYVPPGTITFYSGVVAPAITPAADRLYLYAKDKAGVSSLYFKDENGVEHDLAAGGGGGATYHYELLGITPDDHHAQVHADTDHSGPNKVQVLAAGGAVGTRPALNFIGTGVSTADDPANGRINITINASGGYTGAPLGCSYVVEDADPTLTNERVLGTTVIRADTWANRGAPAKAGRLFFPSDAPYIVRDSGSELAPWGPLWRMKPPDLAQFSWVNQGSAAAAMERGYLYMSGAAEATVNLHLLVRSLPAPPYRITAYFLPSIGAFASWHAGLCLRDSVSGKIITFACGVSTAIPSVTARRGYASKWDSPTALSAHYGYIDLYCVGPQMPFFSIWDNGVDCRLQFSVDGQHFFDCFARARNDFCLPNQYGMFIMGNNATAHPLGLSVLHLEVG